MATSRGLRYGDTAPQEQQDGPLLHAPKSIDQFTDYGSEQVTTPWPAEFDL